MAIPTSTRWLLLPLVLVLSGCGDTSDPEPRAAAKDGSAPKPAATNKVNLSNNIWLETEGDIRRILVSAEVCLRSGVLEQLMTRKNQKEHEAILTADIDARKLHEALLLAKAEPGSVARFDPTPRPATGTPIRITLRYDEKGEKKNVSARSWVRNFKTKTELECDWVFAGSQLVQNPFMPNAPKHYLGNDGDVICVCNFEGAVLDLPVLSSKGDADRGYEAWTERIPPEGTRVVVVLEPQLATKK